MNHISVDSNLLASLAYDGTIMQVLYRRGGLYNHENVTVEEFEQLLNPGPEFEHSVGKAYNAIIKGHKPTVKVEAGSAAPSKPEFVLDAALEPPPVSRLAPAPEQPPTLPAEAQEVNRKSTELATQANAIEVTNPVQQREASELLLVIASMQTEIQDVFKPMKDAAYKAHKAVCTQETALLAPLNNAEQTLKARIGVYALEQRRLAREAEEANRRAEEERSRLEAAARAEEQAILQAIELESRGDVQAAQAVLENPAPVPVRYVAPAPVAPQVAQVKGVATRFEWAGRVIDAEKIPREYMTINEELINAVIKRSSGKIRIAGVENYERPVTSSSRRAR